jgi:hypothetical protein
VEGLVVLRFPRFCIAEPGVVTVLAVLSFPRKRFPALAVGFSLASSNAGQVSAEAEPQGVFPT